MGQKIMMVVMSMISTFHISPSSFTALSIDRVDVPLCSPYPGDYFAHYHVSSSD